MDTKGMGGETAHKTIRVRTSDPDRPVLELIFKGRVKPVYLLSDKVIRLTGNAGREIVKTVTIRPGPENPFHINSIQARNGRDFQYDLTTTREPESGVVHHLRVRNRKSEKGWYTGKIVMKTDSALSPVIEMPVMGVIRDNSSNFK